MSELATLARPYARAVYKQAKEKGTFDQWSNMLQFLSQVMADPDMAAASDNPKVDPAQFFELLSSVCEGKLNQEGNNLIQLLVRNDKLRLMGQINELFEAYKAEDEGYLEVEVSSAFAMTEAAEKKLSRQLEKAFKKKIHLQLEQDSSLIGGVIIRAGDRVIDGSVSGQLQQLAKQL